MMKTIKMLGFTLVALLLFGLGFPAFMDYRSRQSRDEWFNPPPAAEQQTWEQSATILNDSEVLLVPNSKLSQAEALLRTVSAAEITSEEAEALSGQRPAVQPGQKLFLLRSMRYDRVTLSTIRV